MDATLDNKLDRMRAMFAPMRNLIVAFSGGVDSTFVLKVAHDVLGDSVLALTTTSPTMPDDDRESALAMARLIGARHLLVESNELEIAGYAANPLNRCYLCKHNLFTVCEAKAGELGIDEIVDGLNLDDLHDYRPGMQAATEKRVRHPLVEAEMTKADVRELSRAMELPTWDRPASPCLSSRFPYGTEITPDGLRKVAAGEKLLHSMGFAVARVRYHGDVARLELEQSEIARVFEPAIRETIDREFKKFGFRFVAIDLKGFRSGSLNEGLVANGARAGGSRSPATQSSLSVMAGGAIGDSSRPSDGRLSAASARPRDFTSGLPFAALAAIVTAVMFELSGADPRLYPFALLAPLPILAVAPELRTETAAQLAFLAFLDRQSRDLGRREFRGAAGDDAGVARHGRGGLRGVRSVRGGGDAAMAGVAGRAGLPDLRGRLLFHSLARISARHVGQPRLLASRFPASSCRRRRGSACAA